MKVFKQGYGDTPIDIDLGKYGFAEFNIDRHKLRLAMAQGFLMVRVESMGGVIKVLPRVANEVYIGVEKV